MAEEAAGIVALGVQIALKIAAYARERGHWRALALAVMQEFDELRWMIVEDVAVAKGALKMIKNPKGPEKGLIKKLSISVTALNGVVVRTEAYLREMGRDLADQSSVVKKMSKTEEAKMNIKLFVPTLQESIKQIHDMLPRFADQLAEALIIAKVPIVYAGGSNSNDAKQPGLEEEEKGVVDERNKAANEIASIFNAIPDPPKEDEEKEEEKKKEVVEEKEKVVGS